MKPDRAAFEKWAKSQYFDMTKHEETDEGYSAWLTQSAWAAWQAASEYVCSLVNGK